MFDPFHAGIKGQFCCMDNALFVLSGQEAHARDIVPLMQGLVRKNEKTYMGVPDGLEAVRVREELEKIGYNGENVAIPASAALDPIERTTSRTGLLFSGVWKIYSHLCTLSYSYYIKDESFVPDEFYDQLWKAFDYRYSQTPEVLRNHPHFKLLKYADIEGGSFHRVPEWPLWVQNAAQLYFDHTRLYCE